MCTSQRLCFLCHVHPTASDNFIYIFYESLRTINIFKKTRRTIQSSVPTIGLVLIIQTMEKCTTQKLSQYSPLREYCISGNIICKIWYYISEMFYRNCVEMFGPQFNLIFIRSYWNFCLNHVQILSLFVTKFCLLSICSTASAIHRSTNTQIQNKHEGIHLI